MVENQTLAQPAIHLGKYSSLVSDPMPVIRNDSSFDDTPAWQGACTATVLDKLVGLSIYEVRRVEWLEAVVAEFDVFVASLLDETGEFLDSDW